MKTLTEGVARGDTLATMKTAIITFAGGPVNATITLDLTAPPPLQDLTLLYAHGFFNSVRGVGDGDRHYRVVQWRVEGDVVRMVGKSVYH